ncbi:hypothetical protein [Haloactinomyces albus]|uniref:Ca2+/Na+ antiporter n=1 Tax=Haloactinomyces albus TaxID=1352928 RepID=A0AAE3ZI53_9ACTN|nr:hypothetical protein [Haloactinomyces albus]MDR7304575.1 Ca2+/Na+ antiporter [Haloactinomyces albus]
MMASLEFALGIALLVYSAEKLIGNLVGVSSRWVVSLFLVAVLFTGIEFDDLAYGIVLNVEELQHAALGTVIGTTIAIMGIVLALATTSSNPSPPRLLPATTSRVIAGVLGRSSGRWGFASPRASSSEVVGRG